MTASADSPAVVAIVGRYLEALERFELEEAADCFTEDLFYSHPPYSAEDNGGLRHEVAGPGGSDRALPAAGPPPGCPPDPLVGERRLGGLCRRRVHRQWRGRAVPSCRSSSWRPTAGSPAMRPTQAFRPWEPSSPYQCAGAVKNDLAAETLALDASAGLLTAGGRAGRDERAQWLPAALKIGIGSLDDDDLRSAVLAAKPGAGFDRHSFLRSVR